MPKRILLVEDQPSNGQPLLDGLESLEAGFEIQLVASAEEALQAQDAAPFDLLVADVMLPGISGLELMDRFRAKNPALKAILLSSLHDPEIRKQVARSGAEAFFFKPVEVADLLDAVERIFGLAKSFLPPEIEALRDDREAVHTAARQISKHLHDLHFNLQATSTLLISERGQILARAGSPPDTDIETTLMPHLLSLLSAANRVAVVTNTPQPDDFLVIRNENYHLHMTSLNPSYALLLITKPQNSARMAAAAETVHKAAQRIVPLLQLLDETSPTPAKAKQASVEDTDPHLEKLLDEAHTNPYKRSDTDKYWKERDLDPAQKPHTLTYDQAARLGLAPKR